MKIKRLYINNYKSLVNFELVEPNPFSVFVGPNAAGKSNVFEVLEYFSYIMDIGNIPFVASLFGGLPNYFNKKNLHSSLEAILISIILDDDLEISRKISKSKKGEEYIDHELTPLEGAISELGNKEYLDGKINTIWKKEIFFGEVYSRIFVGKEKLVKVQINSSNKLRIDAANLEPVLHRILHDETKREEIAEWLELLIPGLEKVEVAKSDLSGDYYLRIFEKHLDEPISKNLISDGTYNILALLTAVYQSDEPQFLCIEEPENGLNPYVIRTLVGFFRQMCEDKGHYIWLNTHSATLVRELKNEEIILIDKKEGITQAKQIPADFNRYDLEMDEAWLTNALGGGLPW